MTSRAAETGRPRGPISLSRALLLALTVILAGCALDRPTQTLVQPTTPGWNQYAAKFVCGTVATTTSDRLP